ncbi:unnamed protein product [Brassicogethes aeneus]|uniref:Uncharacterized protein n=1 Tax=Brassicogethes aeneus TaxID=1431903 RepID=A0A9P0FKL7_BRAAE|nr:unnamed protein product [Brassicogethes aeneus]
MYKFVFLTFVVLVSSSDDKDLPPNFPKCYRDWPIEKFDDCMVKATEILQPILRVGVKKLGFPPLNPLLLPEVTLEQEGNTAAYKAYVTNFALYGLDNYNFKKIHFDWKKHYAVVEVDFDQVYITGIYVFNGKLLQIPLEGQGDFKANITKATQKTIKDNIADLVETLKPAVVEVIISLFKNVYFKEMDSIPYDTLFPKTKK